MENSVCKRSELAILIGLIDDNDCFCYCYFKRIRLVPLIRVYGLCSFEFSGLRSHLLLCVFGRTYMIKKRQFVQDLIPPPNWHVYFVHMYENIYMPRFSPSGFFGLCRCLVPASGLTIYNNNYPMCSVCVCVRIRTHTPTYTLTRVKNRQHPYLSFC